MPGILCSVFNAADGDIEQKWQQGLHMLGHHPEHHQECHAEPGFLLACVYHPEVCQGPRIVVGEHHVLAYYGNLYEDVWAHIEEDGELTRTLLDTFVDRGPEGLKHLNGRYDIAVWDRKARVLHQISDRFGAHRHYLLQHPGALHLSCEIKSLTPHLDHPEIDPAGLASMLSFGFHLGDLTLLKGIRCLPNARLIWYRAEPGELSVDSYWTYPYGEQEPWGGTEHELGEALHAHLKRALTRRMRGVRKILLPISGGLDSRAMAGLLADSGFSGDVLAYSYGQASSRDVRYGRAIAKKLGYRHVTIPSPDDLVTQHMHEAAWYFDAEWSAELNWGPRFSHCHPSLGNTSSHVVLSGMFGDLILGEFLGAGNYRQLCGDMHCPLEELVQIFFKCNLEYGSLLKTRDLFQDEIASSVLDELLEIVRNTISPLESQRPFFALNRSEFLHRQRRHTATVAQSLEYDRKVITPFLDRDVVDFATRIPYEHLRGKTLYKHVIRDHLPVVAAIPYGKTGLPLTPAPVREALQWRIQRMLSRFPTLAKRISQRQSNFRFQELITRQSQALKALADSLGQLVPPLDSGRIHAHYHNMLAGKTRPADQALAILPPALFLIALRQQLQQASGQAGGLSSNEKSITESA